MVAGLESAAVTDIGQGKIYDVSTAAVFVGGGMHLVQFDAAWIMFAAAASISVGLVGTVLQQNNVWRDGDTYLAAATVLAAGPLAPVYLAVQIPVALGWVLTADTVLNGDLPFAPAITIAYLPIILL